MGANKKQTKWKNTFQQMVENSLKSSIELVKGNINTPQVIHLHMDSITSQIYWGSKLAPHLTARLLVAAHPWPTRWGMADVWRVQLEQMHLRLDSFDPLDGQVQACLADIFYFLGQSRKVSEIAEAIFSDPSTPPDEFALRVSLAGGAWLSSLVGQEKTLEAEYVAGELLKRLESNSAQTNSSRKAEALAVVLLHQSIFARRKGNLFLALDLISQAIETLERQENIGRSLMSELIQSRAVYYWAGANYPAALADLEYAQYVISMDKDNVVELSSVHGNRGLVYWSMSEYDMAEKEFLKAIYLSEQNKSIYLLMKQVGNLGMVYFNRGDLLKALLYIEREIELAKISNDEYENALGMGNKAAILAYTDHAEQALPGMMSALQKYINTDRFETLVSTLVDLSTCYYRIGDLENSSRFAQRAFDLTQEKDNPVLNVIACRVRALSMPTPDAFELLSITLKLAEQYDRKLDVAGCKIFMAYLTSDSESKTRLWDEAVAILEKIGATKWIENKKPGDPIVLPMTA
ncbi:MAG: tetratricopeptide repeat protein [Anaerolineales bacterium]|nr:tetratricopeptide repeat protein [Anaerolineales bacterium]